MLARPLRVGGSLRSRGVMYGRQAGSQEVPDDVNPDTLSTRAINRATLARQYLLERTDRPVLDVVHRLGGLQAQTPHTWYVGMWTRVADFDTSVLSDLLASRRVVRMALLRSTIHLVTADDAWGFRGLLQPALERMAMGQFRRRLDGLDLEALEARGRAFVEAEPRTFKALGDHLLEEWPDRDRLAMEMWIRTRVPLVQVPPRGLWGRSGAVAHISVGSWLGAPPPAAMTLDDLVRRYLAAFGPAGVMDAQVWCGLTKLREVFDRLRPELRVFHDERGRELFDVPDAPRPDPRIPAPPRFLYDYENLLLSYADRSRAILPERTSRIVVRDNESISTFLVDGLVAGTWKLERMRDRVTLVLTRLTPLSKADERALAAEAEALLAFLAPDVGDRDVRYLDA